MAETLLNLCERHLMEMIMMVLDRRKKLVQNWVVSVEDWIQAMKLQPIKVGHKLYFCP